MARTGRHPMARAVVAAVVLAASTAACGVPIPPELPATDVPRAPETGEVDRLEPRDDGSAALIAALTELGARVAEARDLLREAETASGTTTGRDGAASGAEDDGVPRPLGSRAVGVLLGVPGGDGSPGLLPAIDADRAGAGSDDLVTALVTLAGDVGGERSRLVIELVRDPMLGDLGAWQRDPVGVIALLRSIAAGTTTDGTVADAAALDAAILELPGELTRALGYALVVESAADPALAAHAARQGAGRLGVVVVAIELAVERLGTSP